MITAINADFEQQYIPARIVNQSEIYIIYYAYHPVERKLKPVKMRFNHLRKKMSKTALDRHVRKIANDINVNLAAGRNPFISSEMPKAYESITTVITNFMTVKTKEMRADGLRSYRSFSNRLVKWLDDRKLGDLPVIQFTEDIAIELMTELELDEKIGVRTWNNHFVFYRSLWNWMIEKKYCKENPFQSFKKKREHEKFREPISTIDHGKVVSWCRENSPRFEIVVDLVRAAFVRPAEICRIRIGDIDLFNQVITIPPENAKTHSFRYAYLPEWLCKKIVELYELERYSPGMYLISTGMIPGRVKKDTRDLDKIWHKLRDDKHLDKTMQLYSYRDTGITALENKGVATSVIRKLTDHKSDKMLRKYVRKPSQELIDSVVKMIIE